MKQAFKIACKIYPKTSMKVVYSDNLDNVYSKDIFNPQRRAFIKGYIIANRNLKRSLLKWAKSEQEKCSDETHLYAQFMNVLIDKLNSI